MRITVDIELEQVGAIPSGERALTIAVARALLGKVAGGRLVWAKGVGMQETAYRVTAVSGGGFGVRANDATGQRPVEAVKSDASA